MAGYTRQDTANNIANGNVIDADDFDAEYNAVEGAFNASTGHKHDGTAGEGSPIEKVGPSQDLIVSASSVLPKTTDTLDLGSSSGAKFKDAFFTGTVTSEDLAVTGGSVLTGNATVGGTLGVTGATTLSSTAAITGNTTVGGTLGVTGASTLDSAAVTNNATVGGTLGVTGNSTLSGTLGVTGNTTVGGTLGVTGNTTIAGTLGVTGSSTLEGSVSVEGKTIGEYVQDTVGSMVTGNTESGISVLYRDDDGTLDFNVNDPDITLTGGVTGTATMTNLGDVSISTSLDSTSVRAKFSAGEGIDISSSGVISGENATTSNRGVASFDTTDFVVTSGAVSLRHAGVEDIVGGMVTGNSENGITVTYQTSDNTLDFNVNDPTISLTGAVTGSATMTNLGNVSIATTATSDPTITLTGAVTGSGTMTNLGNVSISTTATADPTLTLTGDASGSATFTNLGNASLSVTVANDSHTHDGRYYTETESDSRFTASAGDVMTGTLRFNDNVLATFGSSNDAEFFCNGSHMYLDLNSGIGNFYIRDGSTTKYTFNDNGNLTATGSVTATAFYYSSDERLKENITPVTDALDVITNLRGVEFDWKGDGTHDIGVIAQEVEAHIPEAVTQSEDADHKTVSAAPIIAYLIEAVKELKAEVDRLNDKP